MRRACAETASTRAHQRCFAVKGLTRVGIEHRGDIQRLASVLVAKQEYRRGRVPRRVAAGLKRRTDAAGREGRSVRLTLDEHFPGKLAEHLPVRRGRQEGVVLFSRQPGHGLEPVGVMRSAVFESPILHGSGDDVGIGRIKRGAMGHGPHEAVIHFTREALTHDACVGTHRSHTRWQEPCPAPEPEEAQQAGRWKYDQGLFHGRWNSWDHSSNRLMPG